MKSALWLPAAGLCLSAILDAQHTSVIPVVKADGPTIVAFFPNASQTRSDDQDSNEALSDFEFYANRAKEPLNRRGIEFTEQFGRSFRIRMGSQTRLFTPKPDTPGYYFVAHGKKPRVEYGVMTDTDLLDAAKQYFGFAEMGLQAAEPCTTIHGRLHFYGGDGQLLIWHIGTHHDFTPDESSWDTVMNWLRDGVKPSERKDYSDPAIAVNLYGDFEICPTEPFRKGAVQHARVIRVSHRRYVKNF